MAAIIEGCSNELLNTFGFNEVLNVVETIKPITHLNIDQSLLIDLNHLSIVSKISEGSSSIVFEGRYKTMPVAVKMLNPTLESIGNMELREIFAREVMMLSLVKHDNLVSFIGASMEPHLLIVTQLMKGGSLRRYLWDMRPACPDLQQSISFALDISRAMEHLHANGIIHRDLKPANLVLTEDHKSLKVADFGLAREESTEEMTSEAGTYRWMAPELFSKVPLKCEGKQYYDHKIDIYSFAIVLWEMLTNKMPFKGMSSIQAVYAVAKKHRPSVDDIPEHLVRLLESCWAEDPTIRPEFTMITAYLLDILKAMTNEEQNTIQLQVAGYSPRTRHLMDESSTQLQVADSPGTHNQMDDNSTQLQVANSPGTRNLMDENSTQLQVADSLGTHLVTNENPRKLSVVDSLETHHVMNETSPQLTAADSPGTHLVTNENPPKLSVVDSPETHHVMNETSPQLPPADSPGTRCLMDETSKTELVEGRNSGNGLFNFLLGLCRRRDVRKKKKSGNGLFSCVFGLGMRRDVRGRRGIAKSFTRCAC